MKQTYPLWPSFHHTCLSRLYEYNKIFGQVYCKHYLRNFCKPVWSQKRENHIYRGERDRKKTRGLSWREVQICKERRSKINLTEYETKALKLKYRKNVLYTKETKDLRFCSWLSNSEKKKKENKSKMWHSWSLSAGVQRTQIKGLERASHATMPSISLTIRLKWEQVSATHPEERWEEQRKETLPRRRRRLRWR